MVSDCLSILYQQFSLFRQAMINNNKIQQPMKEEPNMSTLSKTIGNYTLQKTIGKGTFGKVKVAINHQTQEKVAIKILNKQKIIDISDVQRVNRQIFILKMLRHPAIIQLYQIIETQKHLFLIMQYLEKGELFEHIVKHKRLPEEEACSIFQQLISSVEYIHRLKIVHRDLKPENLLLAADNSIRVVDFGLSNTYSVDEKLKTACGSPCYAAPQMIEGKSKYEPIMVDIWSCGVILYAMICGFLPFEDPETTKLYKKIMDGKYYIPEHLSEVSKDFLSKILEVNPDKRLTVQQIKQHKWWQLSKNTKNISNGLVIGFNQIPVDEKILSKIQSKGFNKRFVRKCVEANRHTIETSVYYLEMKKHIREGGESQCELGSKRFDEALIEPIRKDKRLLHINPHIKKNVAVRKPYNFSFRQEGENTKKNPIMGAKQAYQKIKTRKNISVQIHELRTGSKKKTNILPGLTNYNPQSPDKFSITRHHFGKGLPKIKEKRLSELVDFESSKLRQFNTIEIGRNTELETKKNKSNAFNFNNTINWSTHKGKSHF